MVDEHTREGLPTPGELVDTLAPEQFYRREGARLLDTLDPEATKGDATTPAHHRAYHAFDVAHLLMLVETGLIPRQAGLDMLAELHRLELAGEHVATRQRLGYGLHAGEAHLVATLGESVGGWLHLGRSSRDLRETADRMLARERLLNLSAASTTYCETLLGLAEQHASDVVPTYTRSQHAQVSTFGHLLVSWVKPVERALKRILECYQRVNVSPAGSVAGTATDFPINRALVAELLGFGTVSDSATDDTQNADLTLEVAFLVTLALEPIGRAARRLRAWSGREFGYVSFADEHCDTSSIMPQKKNPTAIGDILELIDQNCGSVATAMTATNRLQGRPRMTVAVILEATDAVSRFNEILSGLTFETDRAREAVFMGWALATDLAGLLVREAAIPWRSAHQICAIVCRECHADGVSIRDLGPETISDVTEAYMGRSFNLDEEALAAILDPTRAIHARSPVRGSPAPERLAEAIAASKHALREHRAWEQRERKRLEAAKRARARRVADVLGVWD